MVGPSHSSMVAIINRNARYMRTQPAVEHRLRVMFRDVCQMYFTHNLSDLHCRLDELAQSPPPKVLWLMGGDGTIHHVLTGISQRWPSPLPKIVLLPGGTMNVVAKELGLSADPLMFAKDLLNRDSIETLPTTPLRLLRVNDRLGVIWGIGAFERFVAQYQASGRPSRWMALRMFVKTLFDIALGGGRSSGLCSPLDVQVVMDDVSLVADPSMYAINAASIAQIGFGFRPFVVGHKLGLGLLTLQGRPQRILRALPRLWQGVSVNTSGVGQRSFDHMVVQSKVGVPWMMDGELFAPARQFTITAGPGVQVIGCKAAAKSSTALF